MEILKDELIVEILSCVHKTLLPYFQFYANNKGHLNFDAFSKFCLDFGIFPDVLNKPRMMKIFSTLSNFYHTTNLGNNDGSSRYHNSS